MDNECSTVRTAVIGVGNVLYGDDGVGVRVVWELQKHSAQAGSPEAQRRASSRPCGSLPSPAGRGAGVREHAPGDADSFRIPAGVDLIDGGSMGVELLEYLKDYDRVIIIDAADMGLPPGTVRVFTPDDVMSLKADARLSLHSADVLGTIELGRTLGENLAEVFIVAVQPQFIGPTEGLGAATGRALPRVISAVRAMIGKGA